MGADDGWRCLRDAARASLRSRRRWVLGGLVALLAGVVPALVVALTAIRGYPVVPGDAFRLPPPRIGLVELPLLNLALFEETFFEAATDAGLRALLVALGALIVALGPTAGRSEAESSAGSLVPLGGWIVVEVVLGGVAIAVVGGLVGDGVGRWLRFALSMAWIAATVLVVPAIVLGGRSLVGAVSASIDRWRRTPVTLGVAVGGLALVGQGGYTLLRRLFVEPLGLLLDVPAGGIHGPHAILLVNLALAVPLALYAAVWWTLQAELWARGPDRPPTR